MSWRSISCLTPENSLCVHKVSLCDQTSTEKVATSNLKLGSASLRAWASALIACCTTAQMPLGDGLEIAPVPFARLDVVLQVQM